MAPGEETKSTKKKKREKKRNGAKRVREEGAVRGFQGEKKVCPNIKTRETTQKNSPPALDVEIS